MRWGRRETHSPGTGFLPGLNLPGKPCSDPFTCAQSRILHDSSSSGVTFSTALHYKSVWLTGVIHPQIEGPIFRQMN